MTKRHILAWHILLLYKCIEDASQNQKIRLVEIKTRELSLQNPSNIYMSAEQGNILTRALQLVNTLVYLCYCLLV